MDVLVKKNRMVIMLKNQQISMVEGLIEHKKEEDAQLRALMKYCEKGKEDENKSRKRPPPESTEYHLLGRSTKRVKITVGIMGREAIHQERKDWPNDIIAYFGCVKYFI